jgi:hypothetical protein
LISELYIYFPEETTDRNALKQLIKEALNSVYKTPMEKLWKRMDNVYDTNTLVPVTALECSMDITNHRILHVRDYVMEQYAAMRMNDEFDRSDMIDYLTWALGWYARKEPLDQEREVSLIICDGNS